MSAKILCACANGSGTSLMMQLTVERVAKKLGMDVADQIGRASCRERV